MSSPQMMPDPSQLGSFLWGIAETRVTSRSFRFSPECKAGLRSLIDQGVQTLLARETSPTSTAIMNLQNDIDRLVDKMIEYGIEERRAAKALEKEAQSKDDLIWEAGGFVLLHESTLRKAKNWFCPCFPFC